MLTPWLTSKSLSAGDWPFLFQETMRDFSFTPLSWSNAYLGMGSPNYGSGLRFFFELTTKVLTSLSFSWILIERLVWFWPFLILVIFSPWYLARTLFPKDKIIQFLASLIYLFNTYILMIVGGGQVGVALAYALAPLVFIKTIQASNFKHQTIAGVILAFQLLFDPRLALITIGAVVLYWVWRFRNKFGMTLAIPIVIAILLHAFWLLPVSLGKGVAIESSYKQVGWVEFFSFADFSNTISLLHPNWPENIFGKTYFMRPEFLLLPILAFVGLLFINELKSSRVKRNVLFFASLALVGAFLAKGSKPPFGGVYLWLFDHFPGMNLFRDPTKFYLLMALSYSILIPYTLSRLYSKIKNV